MCGLPSRANSLFGEGWVSWPVIGSHLTVKPHSPVVSHAYRPFGRLGLQPGGIGYLVSRLHSYLVCHERHVLLGPSWLFLPTTSVTSSRTILEITSRHGNEIPSHVRPADYTGEEKGKPKSAPHRPGPLIRPAFKTAICRTLMRSLAPHLRRNEYARRNSGSRGLAKSCFRVSPRRVSLVPLHQCPTDEVKMIKLRPTVHLYRYQIREFAARAATTDSQAEGCRYLPQSMPNVEAHAIGAYVNTPYTNSRCNGRPQLLVEIRNTDCRPGTPHGRASPPWSTSRPSDRNPFLSPHSERGPHSESLGLHVLLRWTVSNSATQAMTNRGRSHPSDTGLRPTKRWVLVREQAGNKRLAAVSCPPRCRTVGAWAHSRAAVLVFPPVLAVADSKLLTRGPVLTTGLLVLCRRDCA